MLQLLNAYANQAFAWKKRIGEKDNGFAIFDDPIPIYARIDYTRRLVRSVTGEEIVSEAMVFTNFPVGLGDELIIADQDCPVIVAAPITGLGGEILHYEISI